MREELKNPPLNELIIGTFFNPPLLDLYTHHVGIFWERIRDRYPSVEQKDPIGNFYIEVPNELFPMPRYWFTSEDQTHLVQLQRNGLLLNWRRRDQKYPSFEPVKAEFDRLFEEFTQFMRSVSATASLLVSRCELTYINVVDQSDCWTGASDTSKIIPSYRTLGKGVAEDFSVHESRRVDSETTMKTTLRTVHKKSSKTPALQFEIRAEGQLKEGSKSSADEWFKAAHQLTGTTFRSLTDSRVRARYWN